MKKIIIMFLAALFITLSFSHTAYADTIGINTELDDLEGEGRYVGSNYRNNYHLDTEKLGILDAGDKILNALGNGVFSLIHFIGFLTCAIFYYALDFDLAKILAPIINPIQEVMRSNVFLPLFQIVLVAAFAMAIVKFAKRDFFGVMEQFGKVIFIFVLSLLVVRDSSNILTYATNITKSMSVSILTGVSGTDVSSNTGSYAATAAGTLWVSMVHEPWKSLEFDGYHYTEEDIEFFLSESDRDTRQSKVEEIRESNKIAFSKDFLGARIFIGFIIFLVTLIKGLVYILVAALQIFFQVLAVGYVMMAPIILIISLIPGFDFDFLTLWAKKILETQIGVLLLTFVMGLMLLVDNTLQTFAGNWGWFVVLVFQIIMSVGLFLNRDKILGMLNTAHKGMRYPRRAMHEFRNSGNPYQYLQDISRRKTSQKRTSSVELRPQRELAIDEKPQVNVNEQEKYRPNTQKQFVPQYASLSHSQYVSPEITENWHEVWESARPRPTTESEVPSRNSKAKLKSERQAEAQSRPVYTEPERPGQEEKLAAAQSRPVSTEPERPGQEEKPAQSRPVSTEPERPGQEEKPAAAQSRPVSTEPERPGQGGKPAAAQSRPVSTEPERPGQEEKPAATQSRPVSTEPERPGQEGKPAAVQSRPVSTESERTGQEEKPAEAQSRPVSTESERTGQEEKPSEAQSRPVSTESERTGQEEKPVTVQNEKNGEKK